MSDYGTPTVSGGWESPAVKLTLADLFYLPRRSEDHWGFSPLSFAQLIQVLEGMGAKQVTLGNPSGVSLLSLFPDGSYLVLPLGAD